MPYFNKVAFLLGLVLILAISQSCMAQPGLLPADEAQALENLISLWGRPVTSSPTSWVSGNASRACIDNWTGISCTNGHVTNLTLSELDLRIIPASLARLPLIHLELSQTNLGGPLPSILSNLTNLVYLDLSQNPLHPCVPGGLSYADFPGLDYCNIGNNATDPFCGKGCCDCQSQWAGCINSIHECQGCHWKAPSFPGFVCEDGAYLLRSDMTGATNIEGPTFIAGKLIIPPSGPVMTFSGLNPLLGVQGPISVNSQLQFKYTKDDGKAISAAPGKTISYKYMYSNEPYSSSKGSEVNLHTNIPGCVTIKPSVAGDSGEYYISVKFFPCTYYWLIGLVIGIIIIIVILVILLGKLHWLTCQTKEEFLGPENPTVQMDQTEADSDSAEL